nr:MAG TPA: hypothetical protein [Caudoviricetes sp.]
MFTSIFFFFSFCFSLFVITEKDRYITVHLPFCLN